MDLMTSNVKDIHEMIQNKSLTKLLDVREIAEWNQAHIKEAIHYPLSQWDDEDVEKLFPNKNEKIFVMCKSGMRSQTASQKLLNLGYKKIYNVEGGILAWIGAKYPTVS
jgi:rhodanese-related sulfurtransferase